MVADRYAYIAVIGAYFFIASFIIKVWQTAPLRKYVLPILAIYIGFFAGYTYAHSFVWKNSVALKEKMKTVIESRKDYKAWKSKQTKKGS